KNLGGNTQIQVPFLNEDLSMGYARAKEMVREQRADISKILSSISDLVPINVFSNHEVDQALDAADKKRAQTALDVQDLDQNLTNEYRQITEDLPHIQALYEELIHATRQGADVQPMHFNATAFHDSKIYQIQDEIRKETQMYLEAKGQQEQARIMSTEASLPPDVRMHLLNDQINLGITQGLIDTGKDIVYGFIDMAQDPLKTATSTVMALWNWRQTSALIAQAIAESYNKDMVHGDAYTRSRWVTYALATLVTSVVGTKGVGQVSKVANLEKFGTSAKKIGTLAKTNVAEHVSKAADKINGWNNPFAPKMQIAADVPYNTINSSGLRDKLSKIAENAGKSNFIDHINNVRSIIQQVSAKKFERIAKSSGKVTPDLIRSVDNDILDKMELSGGHTLERHVAQKNENLIKRANQENVTSATSYTNKGIALKATKDSIRFHSDDIAQWLNTTKKKRAIFVTAHKFSIGNGVLQGKKQVIYDLHYSKLVIERDDSQKVGFRIVSSFPIVKK
ncbi:MAG: hypothetical protein K0S25_1995, partial [Bacillus sp. (in: firmicutes)]|nr:hypothetical protein [Bacillus sp. (in: firmicutes)]